MSVTPDTLQRMNAIIKLKEVVHSVSVIGVHLFLLVVEQHHLSTAVKP